MNVFRRSVTSAASWAMLKSTAKHTTTCRQTRSRRNGMTISVQKDGMLGISKRLTSSRTRTLQVEPVREAAHVEV
ncbi:hypothetical protein LINGRAHAP2_LOCUS14430 [Linum grandiflorum]